MIGRTNALVRALVSSVNGMTGVVVLNANIAYDPEEEYESGTIGEELQNIANDKITDEEIDEMYGEIIPPTPELESESIRIMSFSIPHDIETTSEDAPERTEENAEDVLEETETEETFPEDLTEENNEQEDITE